MRSFFSKPKQATSMASAEIAYFETKEFTRSLQEVFLRGGHNRKKHDKVRVVLGSLSNSNPFATLSVTNNGETRIKHCVKYDLGDGWRLVTQKTDKACTFLFMGDHDDTDRWLDAHRGEDIGVRDRSLVRVPGVGQVSFVEQRYSVADKGGALVDMLDPTAIDYLLDGLPMSLARRFLQLDGRASNQEIESLAHQIEIPEKFELIRTVLVLLAAGNVDGAQAHIDFNRGKILPIDDLDSAEIIEVEDGEDVRRIRVGSLEYEAWLDSFEKRSSWQDWFLYLHPSQEKVVWADYPGICQLSGVSGSGKTCVVVRRAMRLVNDDSARVLILTLNRSLAGLLQQLVEAACVDNAVKSRIEVISFFELAQRLLSGFEPENERSYLDVTWKIGEQVEEVFREYYRQWANNTDASAFFPLHKSLNARGVSSETYTREELDWIRSAVPPDSRDHYLEIERRGRKFPLPVEWRRDLLRGLSGWERKMTAVGVVDYLGLTSALTKHLDRIEPAYTNILVDEAQDFGTTELRIIRQLVSPGPNDIFLCGDIAQTVLPKHRSLASAGIANSSRERIQQNYRNSREILNAAYKFLTLNLHEEMFESQDLEILDPRFANFGGPAPMALAAETLEEEIAFARTYAATRLAHGVKTVCVAFAGFSLRDVKQYAAQSGVPALDGNYNPSNDRLVFSDLEQTKGYEFDTLIVLNCCEGVLPAKDALPEESFRDTCKLYVAMTRAKHELILSFHGASSPWLVAVSDTIGTDFWSSYETLNQVYLASVPEMLPEVDPNTLQENTNDLTGTQYLYTSMALGLSVDAQEKLVELVDGRGGRAAGSGRRLRWQNIGSLASDLQESRRNDMLFGPKVAEELRANLTRTTS